jgi:hypothetical protein
VRFDCFAIDCARVGARSRRLFRIEP